VNAWRLEARASRNVFLLFPTNAHFAGMREFGCRGHYVMRLERHKRVLLMRDLAKALMQDTRCLLDIAIPDN
jgi:hypothetical protein